MVTRVKSKGNSNGQECPSSHTIKPTRSRSAALFVFLAAAAGTGIVAADLFTGTHHLLDGLHVASAGHAGLFEFAFLLALESFFDVVHGSCDLPWRASVAAASSSG